MSTNMAITLAVFQATFIESHILKLSLEESGASIGVDGLSCDEAAVIADQEEAGSGDFIDLSLASQRDARSIGRSALWVPFWVFSGGVDASR